MVSRIGILLLAVVIAVCALLADAPSAAATASFYMEQGCAADGTITLSFTWQDGDPAAKQHWIDVSSVDNNWQANTYVSAGPISLQARSFSWPGYRSGTHFYLRFNEQRGDGTWDPTRTYDFVVQQCTSATGTVLPSPLTDPAVKPAATSPTATNTVGSQPNTPLAQPSASTSQVSAPPNVMTYAPKAAATAGEPGSHTSTQMSNAAR